MAKKKMLTSSSLWEVTYAVPNDKRDGGASYHKNVFLSLDAASDRLTGAVLDEIGHILYAIECTKIDIISSKYVGACFSQVSHG